MSDIKFRVWDKISNNWLSGNGDNFSLTLDGKLKLTKESREEVIVSPDVYELLEFTGLKDKNGKEIYEGDIVDRGEEYPEIVTYHEGDWVLDYSYSKNRPVGDMWCNLGFYVCERKCCKVIGNIYENPELLEER